MASDADLFINESEGRSAKEAFKERRSIYRNILNIEKMSSLRTIHDYKTIRHKFEGLKWILRPNDTSIFQIVRHGKHFAGLSF